MVFVADTDHLTLAALMTRNFELSSILRPVAPAANLQQKLVFRLQGSNAARPWARSTGAGSGWSRSHTGNPYTRPIGQFYGRPIGNPLGPRLCYGLCAQTEFEG